jgi:hypothetical protein
MKKLNRWLSQINWIYNLAIKIMATRVVRSGELLTPEYLLSKGWVQDGDFFIETNIKLRDKIWIRFEGHWFTIYHGPERTFVALESSREWFDVYYLIINGDNGRYELAGI